MNTANHLVLASFLLLFLLTLPVFSVRAQEDSSKSSLIATSTDSSLFLYQTEIRDSIKFSIYFSGTQTRYDHDSLVILGNFEKITVDFLEYEMVDTLPLITFTYTIKSWQGISYLESWTDYTTIKVVWNTKTNACFSATINYIEHWKSLYSETVEGDLYNSDSTVYKREMFIDTMKRIQIEPFLIENRSNHYNPEIADSVFINKKFEYGIFKKRAGIYSWTGTAYEIQN